MKATMKLGIIGCGDFLRWQEDALHASSQVEVARLYDPRQAEAKKYAERLGGAVAASEEDIFADPEIGIVALFVPPWIRAGLFARAARAGKHVITTKPLAPDLAACEEMLAVEREHGIKAGVVYGRTGDAFIETAKDVFEEGRFGRLALYRQDWLHAYPQWNSWATDPDKNGGPFMDAMIHNLNKASYLMGRPINTHTFFSDKLSHPDLRCADTEAMVVHYAGNGVAYLFITWAADLATHGTAGNEREHIDIFYMVTDQGWRITQESGPEGDLLVASREGRRETIPVTSPAATSYDAFVAHVAGGVFPRDLATLGEATADIRMIRGHE
jgi:predicted dehydrogenase